MRVSRFSACVAVLLLCVAARGDDGLGARLHSVLERLAACGAVVHARVVELPGGRELYARRADEACTPASNFKLLTSATGLDLFGPEHVFETKLFLHGDDLWIVGSGDPANGDPRLAKARGETPLTMLDAWATEMERRGLKRIKGDLVYDDSAFEDMQVHPSWPKGWLVHWYAASSAGLNFNDNSIDVTVLPGKPGEPAGYEVMPPTRGVRIINECVTAAGASQPATDADRQDAGPTKTAGAGVTSRPARREPTIAKLPGENVYRLRGVCSKRAELMSVPVDNPGAFFADALRTHLAEHGITIDGRIRRDRYRFNDSEAKTIAVHTTRIRDVLSRINKNSQNLFAECLWKASGRYFASKRGQHAPGSWESGGEAVRAFLKRCGIDDRALTPMDGSGLSPANRTSARMLTDLLAVMFSRPDGEFYRASLAVAGVDGSLRERMPGLKGRVFGKTGYIGGVCSCSGYIQTRSGKWLAFSFVYNNCPRNSGPGSDEAAFQRLQDEACALLADWPNIPASQPATSG